MPTLVARASLTIHAPLARVWDIVLDLPRYREWNPFILDVTLGGPPTPGKRFHLHVRFASGMRFTSPERFTVIAPPTNGEATLTYDFDEVVKTLNAVHPHDWAAFLRQRLDGHGPGAPLDGVTRGGYRLVYSATPTDYTKTEEARRKEAQERRAKEKAKGLMAASR